MANSMKNFATPHCHIQSLDSASTPQAFAEREIELGTGVITVTDHGSLAACQAVYELGRKKKLTPVLGLEGYFRDDNCPVLLGEGIPRTQPEMKDGVLPAPHFRDFIKYHHFTTHFMDQAAYQMGVELLSKAPIEKHGSESKPLFTWEDLEQLGSTNATITTGCLIGMVQRFLLDKQNPELALKYFEKLRSVVRPGNLYVEIFPHICTHNWVQGVFVTLDEGDGKLIKLRFYSGKTLKTNKGEIKAEELAKAFLKKDNGHTTLLAVKDYYTWNERQPARIVSVEYVEDFIQNECRPFAPDGDVQLGANQFMLELARKHDLPILVSDDSHYAHTEEKIVQDVRLAQSGSWRFYGSYHRQSSAEAYEYFKNKMGVSERDFEEWVDNSHAWAARFKDFKLVSKPSLPTKFYEAKYAAVGAKNSLDYTLHLIKKHGRFVDTPEYRARLNQEIKLLYGNGVVDLLPYFFIDEEVCNLYTANRKLTGPGRGSAAGCLLAYYLGITHADPIKYGLSFDRFLTLDRIRSGKWPDIDQDLPDRDLLVGVDGRGGWLQERFGDHVAQISTVTTLRLRNTVQDVARFTMGKVPPDIGALTAKFLKPPQGLDDSKFVFGYEDSGNWVKGSIEYDEALKTYVKTYPEQWSIVQKCLGLGRGVGRHACAYVIANEPIQKLGIPLTKISDITCTAFTAGAVEAMGGLKMDFLVINSLNDIAAAILSIQQRSGIAIPEDGMKIDGKWVPSIQLVPFQGQLFDIWDLPPAQEVFKDISTSKTETVFQFNTPGAQGWLKHFNHKKEDGNYAIDSVLGMAAFTALDRPGPLDALVVKPGSVPIGYEPLAPTRASESSAVDTDLNDNTASTLWRRPDPNRPIFDPKDKHNMLVEYANRARGAAPSPDIFVLFDKLFPETYGVMVYQEQLQRLYQEVTGCTGAEAEAFRGDVAKKKAEKIMQAYPKFIEGGTKTLGSREAADNVWEFIKSWAAYGFNKSHAVCYSIIGYACAFLKHFYPLEWWTAVLCNATKEEINEKFWKHCGILVDLPDVTKAYPNFTIVDERIKAPLSLLHGVGEKAHEELVSGAPYTSIADYVARIEQRKKNGSKPGTKNMKVKTTDKITGVVTETTTQEPCVVKGRSALNDGITYKLIVCGAMDKLFGEIPLQEKLYAFHVAKHEYEQAERVTAGKKPSKKQIKPVPDKLQRLDQYTVYQYRKGVLPAYSEPILPMLVQRQHPTVLSGGGNYFHASNPARRILDNARLEFLEEVQMDPTTPPIRAAVAVYVTGIRIFKYGVNKEHQACDVTVDLDGHTHRFVRWPTREYNPEEGEAASVLDYRFTPDLKDSIVILDITRTKNKNKFAIDDIEIVQGVAVETPEEEKEESK